MSTLRITLDGPAHRNRVLHGAFSLGIMVGWDAADPKTARIALEEHSDSWTLVVSGIATNQADAILHVCKKMPLFRTGKATPSPEPGTPLAQGSPSDAEGGTQP